MKALIIVLIIFAFGCSTNNKTQEHLYFSQFPNEVEVKLKEVPTAPVLSLVGELLLSDSFLVAYSMKSDSLFQIFDIPGFKYLGSHVLKGEGPGEELFIVPNLHYYDSNSFLFKTIDNLKIVSYDKHENKIILHRKIDLPIDFIDIMHFTLLNEKIIGWNYYNVTNELEFQLFDIATQKVSNFGNVYPVIDFEIKLSDKASLFSKSIMSRPDYTHFAALYDRYPFLRIYNETGNLVKEVRYNNNQIDPARNLSGLNPEKYIAQQTLNYIKLKVTNNYIYGLYAGKTHSELKTQEYKIDDFCTEIHIWDWQGNPVSKIMLDRPVFSFAVAQDDSFMVFSSVNEHDKLFYMENNEPTYLIKPSE
ncbi:MAG: TolB-like 6-bladed beta-propeller domain-containing protein [Bacteroidales bacterium]|nr:TolB-like 6-bladed beta-propeller domain-containing protein [Bacteroidales bacterium]